jgi:predicted double-glycine peptidase
MRNVITIRQIRASALAAALVALASATTVAGTAHAPFTELGGDVGVTSWQAMQEREVVMQNLDHSCGSAAVATILRYFYGDEVSEKAVLKRINPAYVARIEGAGGEGDGHPAGWGHGDSADTDLAASFAELADAASAFGYKAIGLAASFAKLRTLKIPAIVHVKYRDQYDHFSVLRGINAHGTVRLGDPSWGNTRLSRHQFLEMWRTRADKSADLIGRILLIVPPDTSKAEVRDDFFADPEPRSIPMRVLAPR